MCFSLQAGLYSDALDLCKVSVKWEEKELGNRAERMVELYSLMAEIYDEVSTNTRTTLFCRLTF